MKPLDLLVKRARALQAALYDFDHRRESFFFVDTDIVMGVFFRLTDVIRAVSLVRSEVAERYHVYFNNFSLFARTCWSLGYTCPAHMLCAHASELGRRIDAAEELDDQQQCMEEVKALMGAVFNQDLVESIRAVVSETSLLKAADAGRQLERLLPVEYVSLLTATLPDWQTRLEMIGDQLELPSDAQRERFIEILGRYQSEVDEVSEELQTLRSDESRPDSKSYTRLVDVKKNSYVDACAMFELEHSHAHTATFFSMTPALARLLDTPVGLEMLPRISGGDHSGRGPLDRESLDRPAGLLRSDIYVGLRSICHAIAFRNVREAFEEDPRCELDRIEMLKLVRSAEDIAGSFWPRRHDVRQWNQSFVDLTSTWSFRRVWSKEAPDTLLWLARQVPGPGQVKAMVRELRQQRVKILEANFQRLAEVERSIEVVYRRRKNREAEYTDIGIGRWLLIMTRPFGDVNKLVRTAKKEARRIIPGFVGHTSEWTAVSRSLDVSLSTRCVAAAHLFGRGMYPEVRAVAIGEDDLSKAGLTEKCARLALVYLQQSARSQGGDPTANLAVVESDSTDLEQSVLGHDHGHTDGRRVRCMYAMQAWREYYVRLGILGRGDVAEGMSFPFSPSSLRSKAAGVAAELLQGKPSFEGDVSYGVGEFGALMEWPVLELLSEMGACMDVTPEVLRVLSRPNPIGTYAVDARAWRLRTGFGGTDPIAKDAVMAARDVVLPRQVEPYLVAHQTVYNSLFG